MTVGALVLLALAVLAIIYFGGGWFLYRQGHDENFWVAGLLALGIGFVGIGVLGIVVTLAILVAPAWNVVIA